MLTGSHLKIAYVHPQFPEGMAAFSVSDMLALKRLGHRVEVYSLRNPQSDWEHTLQKVGLEDVHVTHTTAGTLARAFLFKLRHPIMAAHMLRLIVRRCHGDREHLFKALAALPRTFEIYAQLEANPPDVVHAFWGHYPSLLIYMVKRFLPRVPATLFLGAYDLRAKFPISADTARIADAVFTHAEINRTEVEALGAPPEKLHVIRRGLDLSAIKRDPNQTRRTRHIVTVSRLTELKRVDLLIRTFALVKKRWPDATLTIVGDGPRRASLDALVAELGLTDVTFTGAQMRADVLPYIAEAPFFLFMSPKERLPNVLKEAMALGCVCVTAYSDGLEELIPSPEYGFILPEPPVEEGARILGELFSGNIDAEPIRARGREQVEALFDVDKAMTRYSEVWSTPRTFPR